QPPPTPPPRPGLPPPPFPFPRPPPPPVPPPYVILGIPSSWVNESNPSGYLSISRDQSLPVQGVLTDVNTTDFPGATAVQVLGWNVTAPLRLISKNPTSEPTRCNADLTAAVTTNLGTRLGLDSAVVNVTCTSSAAATVTAAAAGGVSRRLASAATTLAIANLAAAAANIASRGLLTAGDSISAADSGSGSSCQDAAAGVS
ncbi:hypothetical protein Vafri_17899, partial [Volvox africanus]